MKKHLKSLSIISIAGIAAACGGGGSGQSPGVSANGSGATCAGKPKSAVTKLIAAHTSNPVSHIPHAVRSFSDQGKYSEEQQLPITVSLKLSNEADLEQKLTEMYTPGSASYGQFMTPDEFKAHYAPSQDQVNQVQAFLSKNGVQSVSIHPNGYLVSGTASVKSLNAMFGTEVHSYKSADGKTYFAPASEPKIPAELSIQGIHGLNNVSKAHSYSHPEVTPNAASGAPIKAGTGHSGGLSPSDVNTSYNMPTSVKGSGQVLGLFELDAFAQSDLTAYEQYYNLPNVLVTPISVDSANTSSPGGGQAEVTLDIELMMAVAPGASNILVYEGPNTEQGMIDTYAKMASDNQAKSSSSSWGSSEGGTSSAQIQAENTIFMQMAAQGQSIFSAAGDSGANDNGSSLSIDDPSGQPYMTAVGGTSLTTNNGAYVSETTWSSGGGGISSVWPIPSWQQGLANSSNKASSTMRNIPDVSLESDMSVGYDIYEAGGWGTWGGTSCAAPIWAAFTALVNQERATNGMGTLGFANPAIYSIGRSSRYGSDFHDIADGSTNGNYPAVTGFDDATGWGTPIGQGLFEDLTSKSSPSSGC